MTDKTSASAAELSVDTDNLHREDVFTDLRAASVRRLTPVKADGNDVVFEVEVGKMVQNLDLH